MTYIFRLIKVGSYIFFLHIIVMTQIKASIWLLPSESSASTIFVWTFRTSFYLNVYM